MTRAAVVKVPGKVLIAGEYSILEGLPGLAFTVDRHLTVRATSAGPGIRIHSDLWREPWECRSEDREIHKNHREPFVHAVIQASLRLGLENLTVSAHADFPVSAGIGSSSALRLGVALSLGALARDPSPGAWDLARMAWLGQKAQQGVASGYDMACQLMGGVCEFRLDPQNWPGQIQRRAYEPAEWITQVHLFSGTQGAPTAALVKEQSAWLAKQKGAWDELIRVNQRIIAHFPKGDDFHCEAPFFSQLAHHRRLFSGSPAWDANIHEALTHLPGLNKTWGYKTTGAGGADSLLVFGSEQAISPVYKALHALRWEAFPYNLQIQGTRCVLNLYG